MLTRHKCKTATQIPQASHQNSRRTSLYHLCYYCYHIQHSITSLCLRLLTQLFFHIRLVSHDSVQSTEAYQRCYSPLGGTPMPMNRVGLAWLPYIPEKLADSVALEKTPIPVYTLAWKGRKAQISKFDEYKMHYFQYLNPCMHSLLKAQISWHK